MQTASIGRTVHVLVDPAENNGSDVAPALIVRAWGEPYVGPLGETQTINARVLLDGRETPWLTSIALYAERPTAEALAAHNRHNPKGYHAVAFWPPQVGPGRSWATETGVTFEQPSQPSDYSHAAKLAE